MTGPYREQSPTALLDDAVAPLWAGTWTERELLGPCTLVRVGARVVGITSAGNVQRARGRPLAVGTELDVGEGVPVVRFVLARYVGVYALVLEDRPWPDGGGVTPVALERLGRLHVSSSATSFAVVLEPTATGCRRVRVELDLSERSWASRGGSGDDQSAVFAGVVTPPPPTWLVDGAPVVAIYSASRLLGTPEEAYVHAIACTTGSDRLHTPSGTPRPYAELVPIDPPALCAA